LIELAAVAGLTVTALIYQAHRFERERTQLRKALEREIDAGREERRELATRIQAPELAPTLGAPEPSGRNFHILPDDDAAHDDYVEEFRAGEIR
jgi:hypothetical protein